MLFNIPGDGAQSGGVCQVTFRTSCLENCLCSCEETSISVQVIESLRMWVYIGMLVSVKSHTVDVDHGDGCFHSASSAGAGGHECY